MIGSSGASRVTGAMISAPEHRVRVHHDPLLAVEPLLLEEDVVRHADLADVVEQPAPLERLEIGLAQCIARPMSPAISLTRSECLLVNGSRLSTALGERRDGLGEHLAHLDEPVVRDAGSCTAAARTASVAHQATVASAPSATRAARGRRGSSQKPRASPSSTSSEVADRSAGRRPSRSSRRSGGRRPQRPSIVRKEAARSPTCERPARRAWITSPASKRGQHRCQRGSHSVPYQGIRPRSSRTSVVPIMATHPPAAGPPRTVAAISGAIETATNVPRGIRTGRADAQSGQASPEDETGEPRMHCRGISEANANCGIHRKHKSRDCRAQLRSLPRPQ